MTKLMTPDIPIALQMADAPTCCDIYAVDHGNWRVASPPLPRYMPASLGNGTFQDDLRQRNHYRSFIQEKAGFRRLRCLSTTAIATIGDLLFVSDDCPYNRW